MEFVKLYTTTHDDPKMLGLSDKAFRGYVNALSWVGRHETDGEIAPQLLDRKVLRELETAGLVDPGRVIHNWSRRQSTKLQMEARRRASRKANGVRWGFKPEPEPESESHPNRSPEVEVEVRRKTKDQEQPATPSEIDPAEALLASDSGAQYLLTRLQDRDERWRVVKAGWLMKLAADFDPHTITDALRFAYDQPDTAVEPYPYLLTICRRIEEGVAS